MHENGMRNFLSWFVSGLIQNILWWECERFPNTRDWARDKLAERFMSMTKHLLDCIEKGQVKQYFEPAFNLLDFENPTKRDNLVVEAANIMKFYENPDRYLK